MLYQPFDEFHNGNGFLHILVIFMAIVMEGDKIPVIVVNS